MLIEYIRYTIEDKRQSQFVSAYKKGAIPLLKSDYCLAYDLCQCVEEKSQFIVRIHWTSAEDHMKKFRSSIEFKDFYAHIKDFVSDIDEMRHYEQLDSPDTTLKL